MATIEQYRAHAQDCLQRADTEQNERDRPIWVTLAQSWLRLAEHAGHVNSERASLVPDHEPASEDAEEQTDG